MQSVALPLPKWPRFRAGSSKSWRDWFDANAFAQVPAGQYRPGNDSVNNIEGPGYEKWNLSLFKAFKLYRNLKMQLRAESLIRSITRT